METAATELSSSTEDWGVRVKSAHDRAADAWQNECPRALSHVIGAVRVPTLAHKTTDRKENETQTRTHTNTNKWEQKNRDTTTHTHTEAEQSEKTRARTTQSKKQMKKHAHTVKRET